MTIDSAANHLARALYKHDPELEVSATGSIYIYVQDIVIRVSGHKRKRRSRIAFDLRVDLDKYLKRPIYGARYIETLIHEVREKCKNKSKSIDMDSVI